jgi:hypothetical protein
MSDAKHDAHGKKDAGHGHGNEGHKKKHGGHGGGGHGGGLVQLNSDGHGAGLNGFKWLQHAVLVNVQMATVTAIRSVRRGH